MKNILSIIFIYSVLLFVSSCEDPWDYSFPLVKTVSMENFNDTSAVFKGEIEFKGSEKIVDNGYVVYYLNQYYFFTNKNSKNEEGMFEMYISSILRKGLYINIAAYAKTNDETVLGKFITYTCTEDVLPEIESITPISGDVNTVRTMVVKNYHEFYATNITVDGSTIGITKTFIAPDTFEIKLPSDLAPGTHSVAIYNKGFAEFPIDIIVTK